MVVNASGSQAPFGGTDWGVPGVQIEAENYDVGGEGVAYHDSDGINQTSQYRTDGVDIEVCGEGGYSIGWIGTGEWLEYTVSASSAANYVLDLRAASASPGGAVDVLIDGSSTVAASVNVTTTGGWQTYQTFVAPAFALSAGTHVIRLQTASNNAVNWNWLKLRSVSGGIALPGTVQAEDYNTGGEGVGYHDTTSGNTGGAYRNDDVDIWDGGSGVFGIGWNGSGEWTEYTVTISSSSSYDIDIIAALESGSTSATISIDGSSVGTINISATGDWGISQVFTLSNVSLSSGQHTLRVTSGSGGFNWDRLVFRLH